MLYRRSNQKDCIYQIQPTRNLSTGQACKHFDEINPEYQKILQSIGAIRQLLIHTLSVQFEVPNATGGIKYLKLLDATHSVKYHLDRLGGWMVLEKSSTITKMKTCIN